MTTRLTSREFNQDTGRAKRAANDGPVYITNRGRPSHVLLTFEAYRNLTSTGPRITDLLASPVGVGAIDFDLPDRRELAEPADLE